MVKVPPTHGPRHQALDTRHYLDKTYKSQQTLTRCYHSGGVQGTTFNCFSIRGAALGSPTHGFRLESSEYYYLE